VVKSLEVFLRLGASLSVAARLRTPLRLVVAFRVIFLFQMRGEARGPLGAHGHDHSILRQNLQKLRDAGS
jgi:hypothetical protein